MHNYFVNLKVLIKPINLSMCECGTFYFYTFLHVIKGNITYRILLYFNVCLLYII